MAYQPHAAVQALLEHAKQAFGVQSNHMLSLFTESGVELPDDESAEQAGIHLADAAASRRVDIAAPGRRRAPARRAGAGAAVAGLTATRGCPRRSGRAGAPMAERAAGDGASGER
jgi:hypothetical protein